MPTTLEAYIRAAEHDALDQQLQQYLASGGVIERLPFGASGSLDGLYGAVGRTIRNSAKASRKHLDDDDSDIEY